MDRSPAITCPHIAQPSTVRPGRPVRHGRSPPRKQCTDGTVSEEAPGRTSLNGTQCGRVDLSVAGWNPAPDGQGSSPPAVRRDNHLGLPEPARATFDARSRKVGPDLAWFDVTSISTEQASTMSPRRQHLRPFQQAPLARTHADPRLRAPHRSAP
jgi:hypothetical protein